MKMKKLVLALLATTLIAPAAQARDWWVVNASQAACDKASDHYGSGATPYKVEQMYRNQGQVPQLQDNSMADGGDVVMLGVKNDSGQSIMLTFASSESDCEAALLAEESQGIVTDPSKLN